MNTMEERLKDSGAEYRRAGESLPVRRRGATTTGLDAAPHRYVLATVAVLVVLAGSLVVVAVARNLDAPDRVEAIDDEPARVEPVSSRPNLLAAFRRPATASDTLPASVAARMAEIQPELDLSASRAGPSLAGYTAYVIPSLDGRSICSYLVETMGSDLSWGGGCGSLAAVVTSPSPTWWSGTGGTHGIVPDDVIGVKVNGETALLSDGRFLAAGSFSNPDIELVREPERAALVEACDTLGPLLRLEQRVVPVDAATASALMAASQAIAEPAFVDLAEVLAEPGQDGLDLDEIEASDGRIAEAANVAASACRQARVPGWAVVYQEPAGVPGPPAPTVDLSTYGIRQDLTPTDATSDLIHGPGLSPITRAEVGDTGITAFTWERLNPNLQGCLLIQLDNGSTQTCQDRDLSGAILSIDPPTEEGLQVRSRSNEQRASFATAEVGGQTWVQEARGPYFLFILPPGAITITLHESDGATL